MALMVIFAAAIVPSDHLRHQARPRRGNDSSRSAVFAGHSRLLQEVRALSDQDRGSGEHQQSAVPAQRYKDPLNCKSGKCADFKLLHFGEVQMSLSGIGGGTIPGANPVGATMAHGLNGQPGGDVAAFHVSAANSSFGANSNSSFGQNQHDRQPASRQDRIRRRPDRRLDLTERMTQARNPSGTWERHSREQSDWDPGQIIGGPDRGSRQHTPAKTRRSASSIIRRNIKTGCLSTIRRRIEGRLITTPYQPQLQGFGQGAPNVNGQNGSGSNRATGSSNSGFGNSQPVRESQNSPNIAASSAGFGTPTPPSNPPPAAAAVVEESSRAAHGRQPRAAVPTENLTATKSLKVSKMKTASSQR